MTASMVSAGHYNALRLERDQLEAQAGFLSEELKIMIGLVKEICDVRDITLPASSISRAGKALCLSPAQSLLTHDAELMESEAKAWLRDGNATSMYSGRNVNCVLSARARELRNEAEGKGHE
jgi:hypothetical protein